jgi:homoserine dehydrogenase
MVKSIGLAILGCGTVGSGLVKVLGRKGLAEVDIELRHILVRDTSKPRPDHIPASLLTADPDAVLGDPSVDVVVEVMGGSEPAYQYVIRALEARKHVVTANKELMARHGPELLELAGKRGVELRYEASVGGGMPIVRLLHQDLSANEIVSVEAIINGTSNYILTRMETEGWSLERAVAQAQTLGYAEPDPSGDVGGHDAVYKLCILLHLAFGLKADPAEIYREGIEGVAPEDFRQAGRLGYVVKPLALARKREGGIAAGVYPALVSREHPLSRVADVFNGVRIQGDLVGSLFISGRGAGAEPTASALMADVLAVARQVMAGKVVFWPYRRAEGLRVVPFAEAHSRYFIRLRISEAPDLLGRVTGVFSRFGVQVSSMLREPSASQQHLTVLTGKEREGRHRAVLEALTRLEGVTVDSALRVVD